MAFIQSIHIAAVALPVHIFCLVFLIDICSTDVCLVCVLRVFVHFISEQQQQQQQQQWWCQRATIFHFGRICLFVSHGRPCDSLRLVHTVLCSTSNQISMFAHRCCTVVLWTVYEYWAIKNQKKKNRILHGISTIRKKYQSID